MPPPRTRATSLHKAVSASFRERVRRGERLLGTFVKTPSVHALEILGSLGFDFLVIDQEHGPFDTAALDVMAVAARASGTACLVRVADTAPFRISGVLDLGFSGIIAPHVTSGGGARAAARACRHRGGDRGYSNSSRAGGYGASSMTRHVEDADEHVTLIAMIEDADALSNLDEILTTPGVDAILIGRADLAISLGEATVSAPPVARAVGDVLEACQRQAMPNFIFARDLAEAAPYAQAGATGFIIGSDQSLMREAALDLCVRFREESVSDTAEPRFTGSD